MSLFEETSTGLKSKFSALIRLHVKKLNLTPAQVAKILGTDQSRVSSLLSGNLKGFFNWLHD